MIQRKFANVDSQVTFTKDFLEQIKGELKPGSDVTIIYDAERLKQSRGPGWKIRAYAQFNADTQPQSVELTSSTGLIATKAGDALGGGTMITGVLTIPDTADQFVVWFVLSDDSGSEYLDSNFGQNYHFPFLSNDIRVTRGDVKTTRNGQGAFVVDVETSSGITDLVIDYRVTNQGPLSESTTTVPLKQTGSASDGWTQWSTGDIAVPSDVIISYSVTYTKGGRSYFDDNAHRGYLAPVPPSAKSYTPN